MDAKIKKNAKPKMRIDACCPILGPLADLWENVLPTLGDIKKYYVFVRHEKKTYIGPREPSIADVSETVATRCEFIWNKTSILMIACKRVVEKVRTIHHHHWCSASLAGPWYPTFPANSVLQLFASYLDMTFPLSHQSSLFFFYLLVAFLPSCLL